MNFLTPNVILVYYPAFAGGKFIMNSLSLSKHCVIPDPKYALHDLAYTTFDSDYYQFKIESILSSLPPLTNLTDWRRYELREWQLAGITNNDYGNKTVESLRDHKFNPMLEQVVNSGRYHCFLSHFYNETIGFKQVWPNAKLISLVNWKKFVKLAGTFKAETSENVDKHLDYLLDFPSTLPCPSLIYDVDHSIFSRENHLFAIKTLYQALEWDDFNAELVGSYYDQYCHLHGF